MLIPLIGPDPYTPEWYALRTFDPDRAVPVVFGASEAAAVCGLSPYESRLHVYMRKRGVLEPIADNDDMLFGRVVEPAIRELYKVKTGKMVKHGCPMYFHPEHRFISATPDDIVLDSAREWVHTVDYKSVSWQRYCREFGEEGTDQVPVEYLMQAQQQMFVTGLDRHENVVLLDRRLKIFTVERNEELIQAIIDNCREMMERIVDGDPPEPDAKHPETTRLLKKLHPVTDDVIDISLEVEQLWQERCDLTSQKGQIEKRIDEINAAVLAEMKDAGTGILPGGGKIIRSVVKKKAYTVEASEHVQLRGKK